MTTDAPAGYLRLGLRALREFASRLLKCGKRHPAPLCQQAQVCIATDRPLMTELAQEIPHAGMVLQIPRRKVRW